MLLLCANKELILINPEHPKCLKNWVDGGKQGEVMVKEGPEGGMSQMLYCAENDCDYSAITSGGTGLFGGAETRVEGATELLACKLVIRPRSE